MRIRLTLLGASFVRYAGSDTGVVPPALAGKVVWNQTVRSLIHAAYFNLVAQARTNEAVSPVMLEELTFGAACEQNSGGCNRNSSSDDIGGGGGSAPVPTMVGWRAVTSAGKTSSAFVLHLGSTQSSFNPALHLHLPAGATCNSTVLYPSAIEDLVQPRLPVSELGRRTNTHADASEAVAMPPYSVLTIVVASVDASMHSSFK
jgi:hypothetical protein